MKKTSLFSERGLTFIEMLVSLAIFSLILFPLYEFLSQGTRSWQIGSARTDAMQNARMAVSFVTDELRNARALYRVQPHEVRFWFKDLNDNKTADPDEIITYSWSAAEGHSLMRQLDSDPQAYPLAFGVESFVLSYWNSDGSKTVTPEAVRIVSMDIIAATPIRNETFRTQLRASVFVRNAINW